MTIFQTHSQKLANYFELEKQVLLLKEENRKLKDAVQNKLILEEEVNDLKSRLIHYKDQEKKWTQLQVGIIINL